MKTRRGRLKVASLRIISLLLVLMLTLGNGVVSFAAGVNPGAVFFDDMTEDISEVSAGETGHYSPEGPNTGDNSHYVRNIVLMAVSGAGIVAAVVLLVVLLTRSKKQTEETPETDVNTDREKETSQEEPSESDKSAEQGKDS